MCEMITVPAGHRHPSITLTMDQEVIENCCSLLQSGFEIETATGTLMHRFLESIPGFTPEYINTAVQTIFLNGAATDDIYIPLRGEETVLALSAGMPGHLCANFYRKKDDEGKANEQNTDAEKKSPVTLKLFNSIAKDCGPQILEKGIRIKTKILRSFMESRPWVTERISSIKINGRNISELESLLNVLLHVNRCNLTIIPQV